MTTLVLGLGESGLAMARWQLREGHGVRVADTRVAPPMLETLRSSHPDVDVVLGAFDASLLDGIDLVAISPGLSPHAAEQKPLLDAAAERSIPVIGEIELFVRKLAALKAERGYAPRVVAITGTNGKTTVTKLVGRICEMACNPAGRKVGVAGNVSPAALAALATALDGDALPDIWVLELSSFQLETTTSLVADSATVLNVTQDHLDRHGDLESYAAAKSRIFGPSTVRVLNRDDRRVTSMDVEHAPSLTFGLDAPVHAGDCGMVRDGDDIRWLAVVEGEDPDLEARGRIVDLSTKRRGRPAVATKPDELRVKRLMPVDALQLRGDHNVANVLAAMALVRAIGIPMAAVLRAAAAYCGEPHRMAFVVARDGVDWIEDSKGTNVGATVAALNGLGSIAGKVVLIGGGLGKGQDFAPLAAPIAARARAVLLIGRDRAAIRAAIADSGVTIVDCDTLEAAVDGAARRAESGDVVLLSPACASQDMFRDYADRAERFVAAVRGLPVIEDALC